MKPDGSLIFHNILPERYSSVHLGGVSPSAARLYLKSAHLGDEDILGREFNIPNQSSAPLRLTVGAVSMAVVAGVVTDAAAAWKSVAPTYPLEDPAPLQQPDAQTDAQTRVLKSGANSSLKLLLGRRPG